MLAIAALSGQAPLMAEERRGPGNYWCGSAGIRDLLSDAKPIGAFGFWEALG
jgi:hypothetical protein